MEQWLAGLIASVPAPFRPAAQIIVGAILRIYQWTAGLFRRVVGGWNPIYGAAQWLTGGLVSLRDELVSTIKWVILVRIPQWASSTLDWAVRWARDRIIELRDWTRGAVENALRWAADRINAVRSFVDAILKWINDRLADLYDTARRIKDRVFGLWDTPLRMAEWLAGAMWTTLWRYAYNQRDRLVDLVWRSILPLLLKFAAEIERQVGRML